MRTTTAAKLTVLALVMAMALGACGGDDDTTSTSGLAEGGTALPAAELALVAYSTPKEAYENIISAFNDTAEGRNITFSQSYGASSVLSPA